MTKKEQDFLNAIAFQRNQAMDMVASLQAEIAELKDSIAELSKEHP